MKEISGRIEDLGSLLKQQRVLQEMKMIVFAEDIGYHEEYCSQIENGRKEPSIRFLGLAADVLGIDTVTIDTSSAKKPEVGELIEDEVPAGILFPDPAV